LASAPAVCELLLDEITLTRIGVCLTAIALLSPSTASAQETTNDGVRALIRGDAAAAARILRPLADDPVKPDPLAQFFLATLYQSGHGVGPNQTRACALYLRAAVPENPFRSQALALAAEIHQDVPVIREMCVKASAYGWRDPPLTSLTLGPNHHVTIDEAGFNVEFEGTVKRVSTDLGGPGWVYLPIRHTQVDVTRPFESRRDFIEFFVWTPSRADDQPGWTLYWSAFEVIGADVVHAASAAALATSLAVQRPAALTSADLVRISVNGDGDVEWVVRGGEPRGGVIPAGGAR
jgi:hypothetical protein